VQPVEDEMRGALPGRAVVVVPSCNNDCTTEACLRSLHSHHHPCRVVVVDNHLSDDTAAIAPTLADAVVTARRGALRTAQPRSTPRTGGGDRRGYGYVTAELPQGVR